MSGLAARRVRRNLLRLHVGYRLRDPWTWGAVSIGIALTTLFNSLLLAVTT